MKRIYKQVLILIIVIANGHYIIAQEHHETEEFKHFVAAFSIGHGFIPQANSSNSSFVIIPTVGLDFQYWLNPKWGIALKSDLEIANYTVEGDDALETEIFRETPIIISIPIFYSPWDNELRFMAGPGIEFEENENFSILRLGVGYEFELGNDWGFSPEFIYDLKSGTINSFTIAFGVGKRF